MDYKTNSVGQAYDGAAVMSGNQSGVQQRIKQIATNAVYVHCKAHCLNLVLLDTVKNIPRAQNFFSLLQKIYSFMCGSVVHKPWITIQNEIFSEQQPRELQRLNDTRWACRYSACNVILERLPAIFRVLRDIDDEESGDKAVEARGLLLQIDMHFIVMLNIFNNLLCTVCFRYVTVC